MHLVGSCHCGAVKFALESNTPHPFLHCYCSICRKTQGGGGYAVNIMADAKSLQVIGRENLSIYRALIPDANGQRKPSTGRRHFCKRCGSALWVWDPRWPEWIYPFASAIDTPLPKPPETVHIMANHAASWAPMPRNGQRPIFGEYPEESIEAWHRRHGLIPEIAETPKRKPRGPSARGGASAKPRTASAAARKGRRAAKTVAA